MVAGHPDPGSFQEFVEKFMDGEGKSSFLTPNSFKVNDIRQMTFLSKNFCRLFWSVILSDP